LTVNHDRLRHDDADSDVALSFGNRILTNHRIWLPSNNVIVGVEMVTISQTRNQNVANLKFVEGHQNSDDDHLETLMKTSGLKQGSVIIVLKFSV
jgi:hypothetical protein